MIFLEVGESWGELPVLRLYWRFARTLVNTF